jgi:hypothetical protein
MAKDDKEKWVKLATLSQVFPVGEKWLQELVKKFPDEIVRRSNTPGIPTWVNGPGFVGWWVDREMQKRRRRETIPAASPSGDNGDPLLVAEGVASPALEKYREARAALAELDLQERQRDLLPRQAVHEVFGRIASRLRDAGEQLGREHGSEAHEVLDEALSDSQRELGAL